jgi:hypothetical protein
MMEEAESPRAVALVNGLHVAQGVFADPTEDKLFVVSYPKEEVGPLLGFTKKDLKGAIALKLLAKAGTKKINGKECRVYMKTVSVAD